VVVALDADLPGTTGGDPWPPEAAPGADGPSVLVVVEAGDVVGCVWGLAAGRCTSVDTLGSDEHALRMHAQVNMPITGMTRVRVIVTMPDLFLLLSLGAADRVRPSAPTVRVVPLSSQYRAGVGTSGSGAASLSGETYKIHEGMKSLVRFASS
jgi:hypothetical protein